MPQCGLSDVSSGSDQGLCVFGRNPTSDAVSFPLCYIQRASCCCVLSSVADLDRLVKMGSASLLCPEKLSVLWRDAEDHTDIPLLIVFSLSPFSVGPPVVLFCKISLKVMNCLSVFGCAGSSLLSVGFSGCSKREATLSCWAGFSLQWFL